METALKGAIYVCTHSADRVSLREGVESYSLNKYFMYIYAHTPHKHTHTKHTYITYSYTPHTINKELRLIVLSRLLVHIEYVGMV